MPSNYGHRVIKYLYNDVQFKSKYELDKVNYIYTDCDVVPVPDCPRDFIEKFDQILKKYPAIKKVGFGLKIDDLPDYFTGKNWVLSKHTKHWQNKIVDKELGIDLYASPIDTTFCYRRANTAPGKERKALRTGYPYLARHLSWYVDSNNLSSEDQYYISSVKGSKTSYFVRKKLYQKSR